MKQVISLALALCLLSISTLAQNPPKGKDIFQSIDLMVPTGDKAKATPVALEMDSEQLVIKSRKGGSELKRFNYSDIKAAEYSYSKHPRWRAGAGLAIAIGIFALPLFFMKGKKHWLTIRTDKDYAVLRLDKDNYKVILPSFESHSGVKVETVGEDK